MKGSLSLLFSTLIMSLLAARSVKTNPIVQHGMLFPQSAKSKPFAEIIKVCPFVSVKNKEEKVTEHLITQMSFVSQFVTLQNGSLCLMFWTISFIRENWEEKRPGGNTNILFLEFVVHRPLEDLVFRITK